LGKRLVHNPNLFIVGAPKCGTSSLHAYLDEHPDIFMSWYKEPHFFATALDIPLYAKYRDRQTYLSLFESATTQTWRGESSTWYLYDEEAPHNIRQFASDARVIILLRNPFEMVHGLYHQLVILAWRMRYLLKRRCNWKQSGVWVTTTLTALANPFHYCIGKLASILFRRAVPRSFEPEIRRSFCLMISKQIPPKFTLMHLPSWC
jgi:hypothetical protein